MRKIITDYIIESWFLDRIDFSEVPISLSELHARFNMREINASSLISAPKWEPLLRGHTQTQRDGWVPLSDLASTSRGIATGANDFFLISPSKARQKSIRTSMLLPCVGRARDVQGRVFNESDYKELHRSDAKCLLLNLTSTPDPNERAYIAEGEAHNLQDRYLLANRRPWYSMEQRAPAAIWAAVFGRGDLGFVYNQAGARSLTNFHCVYPCQPGDAFARALTVVLNSEVVRLGAKGHVRGYGGGLMKFEPNDLKSIQVPDLRCARPQTLALLSGLLDDLDRAERNHLNTSSFCETVNQTVILAGIEASRIQQKLF
jgi:hypothetical protein